VNAALLNATRVGATSAELFKVAQEAYAAQGFPGEERFHHQGGPTGYGEREWVATPAGNRGRGQQSGLRLEPQHSRRQGGRHGDAARWRDRKPDAHAGVAVIEAIVEGSTYAAAGVLVK
jgi:Xaa-Pro dipeptidase